MLNSLRRFLGLSKEKQESEFAEFEEFKSYASWFIKPGDVVTVDPSTIDVSTEFSMLFPLLSDLIRKARVLSVQINSDQYKLYSWTTRNRPGSCGWLCKQETEGDSALPLLHEHRVLLQNIGGIKERYNEPEDILSNNYNFLFLESECQAGLSGWEEYYHEMCKEENKSPRDIKDLVSFAVEANGNATLYNVVTKGVYLFAHDHAFTYVTQVPDEPPYTFYYINGVRNFVDYVELLAKQWLDEIE